MNAWVRIRAIMKCDSSEDYRPIVETTHRASLEFLVYPSEEKARAAAAKHGGFVVNLDVRELRSMGGADEFNFEALRTPAETDELPEIHEDEIKIEEPWVHTVVAHTAKCIDEKKGRYEVLFENKDEEEWAWKVVREIAGVPEKCPYCGSKKWNVRHDHRGRTFMCKCGEVPLQQLWAEGLA